MRNKIVDIKTAIKLLVFVCCLYTIIQALLTEGWIARVDPIQCEKPGFLCVKNSSNAIPFLKKLRNTSTEADATTLTILDKLMTTTKSMPTFKTKTKTLNTQPSPVLPSPIVKSSTDAQGPKDKYLVIGIPTVGRINVCYVINTLKELIAGLDEDDKNRILIIVFLADFMQQINDNIKEQIDITFPRESNRLIQCIVAPRAFYPARFDLVTPFGGNSEAKTYWIGKQSLDFAFLWQYCYKLGYRFYLHLEDDVSAQPGYFKIIKEFIHKHQSKNWSMLEFGDQGSIGLLYRSSHLHRLHKFSYIFAWSYPINILIRQFNDFHLHGNSLWSKLNPPLFRHVGIISSFQSQKFKRQTNSFYQNSSFPPVDVIGPGHRKPNRQTFLVIGVPTIKRRRQNYLTNTLRGLVEGLEKNDLKKVLILIFLSDVEQEAVQNVAKKVQSEFSKELNSGLIRMIKAPYYYYPNLDDLPLLWKDKLPRVKWRSKQCLDYAFLFHHVYCNYFGKYYLHIEDDIIAKRGYFNDIVKFTELNMHKNWSVLEFADTSGFIGWMYRANDLGRFAVFLRTYFWWLPVDMLGRHFNEFHLYGNPRWAKYRPSLFIHNGHISSLDGQTRKINITRKHKSSTNPEAAITTSIKPAMNRYSDISKPYSETNYDFFWGKDLHVGDYILLDFVNNVNVAKVVVDSGGSAAIEDYFGGASILWSGFKDCSEFALWRSFRNVRQLVAESDRPGGIPSWCIKIEVNLLRINQDKNNTRWIFIEEIAVWTIPN